MKLFQNLYKSVGIDLGTTNTRLYLKGQGIVLDEPTLVAINNRTGELISVGNEAKKMIDRTPTHINLVRPLTNGVISDFEVTEQILKHLLRKVSGKGLFSHYYIAAISVPTNLTEVERKSVEDAVSSAGAAKVYLVETPIASAIGARLPVEEPISNMIVDIGGGTTEISIISVGGAVRSKSLKVAGDKFNEDIIRSIKEDYQLLIGEPTAEELKLTIGSALPMEERLEMAVRGRDMATGLPKEIVVKDAHIRAVLTKSLKTITEAIRSLIEESPPELVGDILKRGIYLSGGGSLLRGLNKFIEREIMVTTNVVDEPLTCAVRGLGMIVEDLPKYETILSNQSRPRNVDL